MEIKIPSNWELKTLGKVCSKPQYGYTTKATSTGRVRLLRTTDITSGMIDWDRVPYCTDEPDDVKKYELQNGDIVISRAGSVGFSMLIRNPPKKVVFASYLIRFRPTVDEQYFNYYLHSPFYWNQISEKSLGIAVPNVNATKLSDITVPIPPPSEQKRIVAKIEELFSDLDKAVESLKKAQAQLKTYRQAVLKYAFEGRLTHKNIKPGQLPEGWKWVRLGEISNGVEYGSSKKSKPTGKVAVLRMGNIQNGKFDWSDLVYSSDKEEIEKYRLQPGDVLFNRTNSPELVGKTAIYSGEQPAIFAGYLIRINQKRDMVESKYLNYFLNGPVAKQYAKENKTDGVNQSNINGKKLSSYSIPLCDIEEQRLIVQEMETRLSEADYMEKTIIQSIEKAEATRQSILKKAFEGRLV